MSEFECRNFHNMGTEQECPQCGGSPHRMDGMTDRELLMRERFEELKKDYPNKSKEELEKILQREFSIKGFNNEW